MESRPGATGAGGPLLKGESFGQGNAGIGRSQQIVFMAAVLGASIDMAVVETHLGVADATHPASPAPRVVVHHYPVAHLHLSNPFAHFSDYPTRLVAAHKKVGRVAPLRFGSTIGPEVAAAQARGFHLDH